MCGAQIAGAHESTSGCSTAMLSFIEYYVISTTCAGLRRAT